MSEEGSKEQLLFFLVASSERDHIMTLSSQRCHLFLYYLKDLEEDKLNVRDIFLLPLLPNKYYAFLDRSP